MTMTESWKLVQTIGDKPVGSLTDGDVVSAVEFDEKGQYLATGDRGGRVRIYEKTDVSQASSPSSLRRTITGAISSHHDKGPGFEYKFWHEFQSHEAEFDYLKSLEIEEKINCLRWCKSMNNSFMLLTTNDKTIKLWKVQDKKKQSAIAEFRPKVAPKNGKGVSQIQFPNLHPGARGIVSTPKRVFANGHAYHINSISLNSDCETFISADDLRINLWNLGISDTSFNIVDIKPANMEELTEVITAASCHPEQCNVFLWSNSRGRDYMCLKLWDVNMESRPIRTIYVHEQLRSKLCDLYENDAIFDKFQCSFSGDSKFLLTGSYHNYLHIYERIGKGDVCIEAAKKPVSKSRLNLPRPKSKKPEEVTEMDLDKKVLHCAWHPSDPCVAVGALNTVYVYHNAEVQKVAAVQG
ncbi:hypothetical protein GUITHDRAFT_113590 [Guillardia theta CCMP2712]|uniref:Serine/threonine-protein phosphatase 2A 55 kDa regulatory subunit B n=1 Tax=Guillardia theta (strain CCMP2712) TaxID=905079 RepID=L1IVS8_GUITC|nr:hypothetical protein GUITHDRAFT_113590 [Guillardia theta CCMP2712]EKX40353.1 hypothetical protein GUITHDRAFT_113590 [Guillardia theta CCMP2712]|eukprot:XP_005827333.1 hypothetical protein GUITHDRAFT_113590 [Guillardia theta CCMP2712]